jgi:hypothetical protein
LNPEVLSKINERLDLEKCYQLLESTDFTFSDIERLETQKSGRRFDSELLNKINEKLNFEISKMCNKIIESTNALSREYIQWLEKIRDNLSEDSQELKSRIDERLELEKEEIIITSEVIAEMDKNPLKNLDTIDAKLKSSKPNRENLVKEIKKPEDVEKITINNITRYLPAAANVSEENRQYVVSNFQEIMRKHLCFHE